MRRVRNPLVDKENFGVKIRGKQGGSEVEAVKMELKAAQAHIRQLQESNIRLQQEVTLKVRMQRSRIAS